MAKSSDSQRDQARLVKALEDIKVRTGYMRTPNSMGWDPKCAHEARLEDGSRQVVIATDGPDRFGMAASQYPPCCTLAPC